MGVVSRIWIAAGLLLVVSTARAAADVWPSRAIHLVVPFPPGGSSDPVARIVGQKLGEDLGQPVVVDNRGGGGGSIGASAVARAPADGYTVLVTTSAITIHSSEFGEDGYDFERDFIPTAGIATQPNVIVIHAGDPAQSLAAFLENAKTSRPPFAAPGSGTPPYLTALRLFRGIAKLDMTPIQFRGAGPAVAAVLAGEPAIGCMSLAGPLPLIRSGKLRALAVSSARRSAALPDVPTLAELGFPGVQDETWVGAFLPAKTPGDVVQKLNQALNRALESRDVRERLAVLALTPLGGPQSEFADYVRAEAAKWAQVVKESGATAE